MQEFADLLQLLLPQTNRIDMLLAVVQQGQPVSADDSIPCILYMIHDSFFKEWEGFFYNIQDVMIVIYQIISSFSVLQVSNSIAGLL